MKITEVRIFQKEEDDKKLRAFAAVTFDHCFVVRDIKIIEGTRGFFVAMPSRRVKESCHRCGHKNVIRSRYCNQCGSNVEAIQKIVPQRGGENARDHLGQSEHRDIAHPITVECRAAIQSAVLEAYEKEKARLGRKEEISSSK